MSEIIIRKYKDDDETAIKNIVKDDYPKYAEDLADFNRDEIIIAEYGGIVAGYLWGRVIHHFQWQIVARVLFIFLSYIYRKIFTLPQAHEEHGEMRRTNAGRSHET